jgi:hypothetical protein
MDWHVVTGLFALALAGAVFELLRRGHLREKYAALWVLTAIAVVPFSFAPGLFDWFAHKLGVYDGANLALFLAVAFLLLLGVHLSWEVSRLEGETRVLGEEIALLRYAVGEREHE